MPKKIPEEKRKLIQKLSEENIPIAEIARRANVSYGIACNYGFRPRINPETGERFASRREYQEHLIRQRVNPETGERFASRREYQEHLIPGTIKERDRLIAQGFTLNEIGKRTNVSRERIRQYIKGTKQYTLWKKERRKRIEKEKIVRDHEHYLTQARKIIAGQIINVMYRRAIEEGNLSWQRTIEYFYSKESEPKTQSLESVLRLFENYYQAQERGEKLSLEELSKSTDIKWISTVSRILSTTGLEPMYGKRNKRSPLSNEGANRIKRTFSLDMPATDIAHFLDLPLYMVSQRFSSMVKRDLSKRHIVSLGRGQKLKYRDASEIYEAQDLGFRVDEICELLDKDIRLVNHAINNREKISGEIVRALKVMYPKEDITLPYRIKNN